MITGREEHDKQTLAGRGYPGCILCRRSVCRRRGLRIWREVDEAGAGRLESSTAPSTSTTSQGETVGNAAPGVGPSTIADIVASAGPAVVRIDTTVTTQVNNPFFSDPFFQQFFGQNFDQQPQSETEQALGSGFLISADGYLLTNEHVIDGAQTIKVTVMGKSQPLDATGSGQRQGPRPGGAEDQ